MLAGSALALTSCGNTLQDQPIAHNTLEGLLIAPYPVYWLGGSFEGLHITEATRDPSGAYSVSYGDCVLGGQGTCVPPLRVVTSPDNSFLPGGSAPRRTVSVRGAAAVIARSGRAIEIPTGAVVVGIFSTRAGLAGPAAQTIVPINALGEPGQRLPARLADTGFAETPLPSQRPSQLRPLD